MTDMLAAPAHEITHCRSCLSHRLSTVVDLGMHRLSDFYDHPGPTPGAPLALLLCLDCSLIQLTHTVTRGAMYHDGYGYKSGINEAIRNDLKSVVDWAHSRTDVPGGRWLDIASNDGTLLSAVPNSRYERVGCDPVGKFADEARQHADRIVPDYFAAVHFEPKSFNVITSVSMFYDVDALDQFVGEVAEVLAEHGVWVIQQNYLPAMLQATSFDNICHEHLTYFSLQALEPLLRRHGLEVFDVALSPINGGCIRTAVTHVNTRYVCSAVDVQRAAEAKLDLAAAATWYRFEQAMAERLRRLVVIVDHALADGGQVMVYGASTRGGTIWQAAGFGPGQITAAIERQDTKVGRWYSAIGVPIISELEARAAQPHTMLVGPWWHRDLFVNREAEYLQRGGRLVFPLPQVEVVSR